jgi:molybdopterin converting factor small subunit
MKVHVRLFARARELVGRDGLDVELAAGATVAELRRRLERDYPALKEILRASVLAVGDNFGHAADAEIPSGAEVAVLPPVSGG